jgi:hypothetical protein
LLSSFVCAPVVVFPRYIEIHGKRQIQKQGKTILNAIEIIPIPLKNLIQKLQNNHSFHQNIVYQIQ